MRHKFARDGDKAFAADLAAQHAAHARGARARKLRRLARNCAQSLGTFAWNWTAMMLLLCAPMILRKAHRCAGTQAA